MSLCGTSLAVMSDGELTDLRGREFERGDLTGARFNTVNLSGATFRACGLKRVVMRDVEVIDTTIDGDIRNLVINGVDVAPLVEAELDRRHPERIQFRPTTPAGFQEAWSLNERLWEQTVQRARRLPPELLHESVAQEWSFVQTLRHLAFATQAWVGRAVLSDPSPWHPLSLPWDDAALGPDVPHDRDARPSLDEALTSRLAAMGTMRRVVDSLTADHLASRTEPLVGAGWPPEGATFVVRECLLVVLNEEWWHRRYAERDLAVLEERA